MDYLYFEYFCLNPFLEAKVIQYITSTSSIHLPTPSLPSVIMTKGRYASQYIPGHMTQASHTSQEGDAFCAVMQFINVR